MAGSFDLGAPSIAIDGVAKSIGVFLFDGNTYTLLPNVRCVQCDEREGPDPPTARFMYTMADILYVNYSWPSQFEQVWPIDAQGPYCVQADDRLVVMTQNPDGSPQVLFDGYVEVPEVDVSDRQQQATFSAVNVAKRAFDRPIAGRTQRDGSLDGLEDNSGESDYHTDLETRFNPADQAVGNLGGFVANCIGDTLYTDVANIPDYPVFLDPNVPWVSPQYQPQLWTVGKAILYLLARYNPAQKYVINPTLSTIEDDMMDYYPSPGSEVMNPDDGGTFLVQPVPVRDYDATNKMWPNVVAELMGYCGFFMRWDTSVDFDGLPQTELKFYRRDEFTTSPIRRVYLQRVGATVGDAKNNLTHIKLVRDHNNIVNGFWVNTSPRQVEVSFVLCPLFIPATGDNLPGVIQTFFESQWNATTGAIARRKYRWFGVDELGEGHTITTGLATTASQSTMACDFSKVLLPDMNGNPTYVIRYRPGHNTLLSVDTGGNAGKPLRATLQIVFASTPGSAPMAIPFVPAVASTLATTEPILATQNALAFYKVLDVPEGWQLLPDRLGIRCTEENPNAWKSGNPLLGTIRAVDWFSNAPAAGPTFGCFPIFVLTTVIDADVDLGVKSAPRIVSPTTFARHRTTDAVDHFKYTSVDMSSRYYLLDGGNGADPFVVRDDTGPAQAHADALRSAHEFPKISGTITLPYVSFLHEIGDQVQFISGRNASLQTNVGIDQGEAPVWAWVVGRSWILEDDRQSTTLTLSDKRSDPRNTM